MPRDGRSSVATSSAPATAVLTRRRPGASVSAQSQSWSQSQSQSQSQSHSPEKPSSGGPATMSWTARNQWIVYAVASGTCAALNGMFAKLTTNGLTAHIARGISAALGLGGCERALEIAVRIMFFGLNLAFDGVMWTLFTKALAKGTSTAQVSIMNTSTNFVIAALLGLVIFAESLPPLWWAGAALLVVGNVIIGQKDEAEGEVEPPWSEDEAAERGHGRSLFAEPKEVDEDVPLIGELDPPRGA